MASAEVPAERVGCTSFAEESQEEEGEEDVGLVFGRTFHLLLVSREWGNEVPHSYAPYTYIYIYIYTPFKGRGTSFPHSLLTNSKLLSLLSL